MKNIIISTILIITILATLSFSGCNRAGSAMNGSGVIIDKTLQVTDFSDIDAEGPFALEIIQSDIYNVILSVDENLISRVLVSSGNRTLKLRIQAPASFFPTNLKIKIGMPIIKNLVLADEAMVSLSGFPRLDVFNLVLKQASSLNGYLEAGNIDFNVSGKSLVNLKGKAQRLQLECSGESNLDLIDFILSSANVRVIGASEANLTVNGRFDVVMDDASKILYSGNPVFYNTSISGDSIMSRK